MSTPNTGHGFTTISKKQGLNTSKISSINVTVGGTLETSDYTSETYARVFGTKVYNGTHDITPTPGGYTGVLELSVGPYAFYRNATTPEIIINSFTTVDGKVHTADNLNY